MTLLARGIVLNDWQQQHFVLEPTRIADYHRQARRIGKTFLSYVMVMEKVINSPGEAIFINPLIDPDNASVRSAENWGKGLIYFANEYYPEVTLTGRVADLRAIVQPKSKKLRLLNAIKDFV